MNGFYSTWGQTLSTINLFVCSFMYHVSVCKERRVSIKTEENTLPTRAQRRWKMIHRKVCDGSFRQCKCVTWPVRVYRTVERTRTRQTSHRPRSVSKSPWSSHRRRHGKSIWNEPLSVSHRVMCIRSSTLDSVVLQRNLFQRIKSRFGVYEHVTCLRHPL